MLKSSAPRKMGCVLMLLFLLSSCAGNDKKHEVMAPEKLYERAMKKFKSNDMMGAAEDFERLESENPYTEYANNSIVMAAYAHYSAGEFDEALDLIDYIKRINFNELEYVYYLEILSKYGKILRSRKDLALLAELFNDIEAFRDKFPNSIYDADLLKRRETVIKYAVTDELDIAKHYMSNANLIGALNHLRDADQKYPRNEYTPLIHETICKLYRHIGYVYGESIYCGK